MSKSFTFSIGGDTRGETVQRITDQVASGGIPESFGAALKAVVEAMPGARVTVSGSGSVEDDAGHLSLTVSGLREAPVGASG